MPDNQHWPESIRLLTLKRWRTHKDNQILGDDVTPIVIKHLTLLVNDAPTIIIDDSVMNWVDIY